MRVWKRTLAVCVSALILATTLAGCFLVPLADNRSPFDSASNASNAEINDALSEISPALESVDTHQGAWRITAYRGADNCEGACNLRVEVEIAPADVSSMEPIDPTDESTHMPPRYAVPEDVLRQTLITAVPIGEEKKVDVRVVAGYREDGEGLADLRSAVEALFGPETTRGDGFWASASEYDSDVSAFTRNWTGVLANMGLE